MVSVAQLVEPRIVIPVVVGSSPIVHPIFMSDCAIFIDSAVKASSSMMLPLAIQCLGHIVERVARKMRAVSGLKLFFVAWLFAAMNYYVVNRAPG